jgi:hypothetical protein
MIRIKRTTNYIIVQGDAHELDRVAALNGTVLLSGDKLTLLPAKHHVHRNPRPALLKRMEDGDGTR